MDYRTDIDGLRAIAVISVILFHLGLLPNGFLGVDIFFVISGYIITSVIYKESEQKTFSVLKFYERRIRRIIPLLLFISAVALVAGTFLMLPDDLENLCQSVFASNFSANNILMYITSKDYWAVKNDYKPLMHTWSLGIEEQFYLLYPLVFFYLNGKRLKYIKHLVFVLAIGSFVAFLLQSNASAKFYFIQFRFFELAVGGLGALCFRKLNVKNVTSRYALYATLFFTLLILAVPGSRFGEIKLVFTVVFTMGTLVLGKQFYTDDRIYKTLLSNQVFVFIGKISFSLYMWHQLVFAFCRYSFVEQITLVPGMVVIVFTLLLSIGSYYAIEKVFRNRQMVNIKTVLFATGCLFLISTSTAFYLYRIGGVIKDYPELGLYKQHVQQTNWFSSSSNIHIQYNEDVRNLSKDFNSSTKLRVLVMGNSFGRDAVNILLESPFGEDIEVRYFDWDGDFGKISTKKRIQEADMIFFAAQVYVGKEFVGRIEQKYNLKIALDKIWVFGTKDFGPSNGLHYNRLSPATDFCSYRTNMKTGMLELNKRLKSEWGDRYIDLIELIQDKSGKVLVFTPQGKFISQDTLHLTKFGAIYFARQLQDRLLKIISEQRDAEQKTS